jgi:hypothetical protein
MRVAISMAKIALGFFLLANGTLHAEDWPMYGQNLSHTFSNHAVFDQSFQRQKPSAGLDFCGWGRGQCLADRRGRSPLCWLLGWLFLCT